VLYEYQPTRAGSHPAQFLSGFTGYIQVDGYAGYNKIPSVTLVGCWSHARRGFEEAIKALPKSARKSQNVTVRKGLNFCNQLFDIERVLKELSPEERYEARLVRSRPVLDAFLAWLATESNQVLLKGLLGKAITYCKNQWDKLTAFPKDGRLETDNN
jgi:transposase